MIRNEPRELKLATQTSSRPKLVEGENLAVQNSSFDQQSDELRERLQVSLGVVRTRRREQSQPEVKASVFNCLKRFLQF